MHTTVLLVRNAATAWTREGRVAGRRDIGLSAEGAAEAATLAERLEGIEVAEVLSSPLPRAVDTAEAIATRHQVQVARDPRLTDFDAGRWEGARHAEIASVEYRKFIANPLSVSIPGGERLTEARDRVVAAVEQALEDNELGANVVVVSHAGPLRVLIAHYLGMDLANYHRLRISAGSVTALRFESERGVPRILTVNGTGDLRALGT
jgi:broad specificity phosphatase PhoE